MSAGDDRQPREPEKPSDLEALAARLRDARATRGPDPSSDGPPRRSQAEGTAWRLAVEMVSALAVCGFIGWWLDKWLESSPWGLLIGLLLGGTTGLVNAFRVARAIQKEAEAADKSSGH
jgi:ATP synthase protein I